VYNPTANKLYVGFHTWANSRRTTGFSVYAIYYSQLNTVETQKIGYTSKKPTVYDLPNNTIAVVRRYVTNSGYNYFYIYILPSLKEYEISEKDNFKIPEDLPEAVRIGMKNILQQYNLPIIS
jgi:stage V sporulation protein SpoVS